MDLDRLCGLYAEATLLNDNTVRTQGQILQIPPGPGRRGYAKARVDVRHLLDGSWRIKHRDQLIAIPAATTGPPSSRLRRYHYDDPSRRWGDLLIGPLGSPIDGITADISLASECE